MCELGLAIHALTSVSSVSAATAPAVTATSIQSVLGLEEFIRVATQGIDPQHSAAERDRHAIEPGLGMAG